MLSSTVPAVSDPSSFNPSSYSLFATDLELDQLQLGVSQKQNSLLFIDTSVEDFQDLVSTLSPGVLSEAEVILIDSATDGVRQISETLADYTNISSVHIVSHSSSGRLQLGATELSIDTLAAYQDDLQGWSEALSDKADILLYGCELGAGETGATLLQAIADFTKADIAASNNITGSHTLGGDWNLELATGIIETQQLFQATALEAFRTTLGLPANFEDQKVLVNLTQPIDIAVLPDGQLLVLQKGGEIVITNPQSASPTAKTYLQLPRVDVKREKGLLSITLDPNFANNNYFYLYYHNKREDRARISRFVHHVDHAHAEDEKVIWEDNIVTATQAISDHWGGTLDFGPDNYLYLAIGDKKDRPADAQNLSLSAGKIIRVDPSAVDKGGEWVQGKSNDHLIPDNNPFIDGPGGNLDEIWAIGLRNPFRGEWDVPSGRFFIGEVGGNIQSGVDISYEDIHVATLANAGANFGWPGCEGPNCSGPKPANYSPPIFSVQHTDSRAIVGGGIYRGNLFPKAYQGAFFFTDYAKGWLRYLTFDAAGKLSKDVPEGGFKFADDRDLGSPVALEVGADGAMYYVDIVEGELRRITYNSGNLPPKITVAKTNLTSGKSPLTVKFDVSATDPENDRLTYLWDFGDGTSSTLEDPTHTYTTSGRYVPTVKVSDSKHSINSFLNPISVGAPPTATIDLPQSGRLFRAGERIVIKGMATDPDETLTGKNFDWNVRFIHDDHKHPVLSDVSGTQISFDIPVSGHDFSDSTGFEITLKVTDSDGLSNTVVRSIFPDKVDLTFDSSGVPGGVNLVLDGVSRTGTFVYDTLIDFTHTIAAPKTVTAGGTLYTFQGWSNGVNTAEQTITVPTANQKITANYVKTTQTPPPNTGTLPVSGLVLNLDADAGVTTSGGVVNGWADQSGRGNHLSSAGDPTLLVGALKGHNVIQLDGRGDKLTRTLTLNGLPDGNKARSMFVVTKYDGSGYGGASYGDNQNNEAFGTIVMPNGKLMLQGWGRANDLRSGVAGTGQGWLIQEVVYDGTTAKHYKDGQLIDSKTHAYNTDIIGGKGLVIGAEIDGSSDVDMDIAAMLVYDRALSDAERQQVEAYLQSKYFGSVVTPPPSNSRPTAVNDTASVEAGKTISINVLANDNFGSDGPGVGSITLDGATHGKAGIKKAGTRKDPTDDTIRFTADAGYEGLATINYTITDANGDTSSAVVTVAVSTGNSQPVAIADTAITNKGVAVTLSETALLSNDSPGNAPIKLIQIDALTSKGGRVNDNGNRTYTYTPANGFVGQDSFSYVIADADGDTSSAVVTVTVKSGPSSGPLPTAGLVLNLDADTGVTTNGGVVSGWADQSGRGNHLSSAGDPTLLVGALKGHNVIQLDGSGDKLARTLTLNGLPDGNKARSMFVVTKYDGSGYGGASYGDNQNNEVFGTIVMPNGKLMLQGWGRANDLRSGVAGTGQGWLIQEVVYDGTTAKHYKDGQLIDSKTHAYNTDIIGGKGLVIGAEIDGSSDVDMDIAAMLVYDRALSDAERQQVEAYLRSRYF